MDRISGSNPGDASTTKLSSFLSAGTRQGIPSPHDLGRRHGGPGDPRGGEGQFAAFAEAIHEELGPVSVLERVLAERAVLSAWTLQAIAEAELAVMRGRGQADIDVSPRGILQVAHCLEKTLNLLYRLREDDPTGPSPSPSPGPGPGRGREEAGTPGVPLFDTSDAPSDFELDFQPDADLDFDFDDLVDLTDEWPSVPRGLSLESDLDEEDADPSAGGFAPLAERWQDRLVYDPNVSEFSPVVRGTWVTVSHVVSLIVDGWTWSDILRTHPELTEDDIRTCLAYIVAQDDGDL